jgi:hypothetical protein
MAQQDRNLDKFSEAQTVASVRGLIRIAVRETLTFRACLAATIGARRIRLTSIFGDLSLFDHGSEVFKVLADAGLERLGTTESTTLALKSEVGGKIRVASLL